MRLTEEEIEELKRQALSTLQAEEKERQVRLEEQRLRLSGMDSEQERAEQESRDREEQVRLVRDQVTEQFYKDRGYRRYVNHRGVALWLTPEEYADRMARRKRRKRRAGMDPILRRRLQQVVTILLTVLFAVLIGFFLTK